MVEPDKRLNAPGAVEGQNLNFDPLLFGINGRVKIFGLGCLEFCYIRPAMLVHRILMQPSLLIGYRWDRSDSGSEDPGWISGPLSRRLRFDYVAIL